MEKKSGFEISQDQRQSWGSIALVWIGCMICVTALMVGGIIGTGLSFGQCIIAIAIGYAFICVYMCFMGAQGCDTGLPTAAMASCALGKKGSRYIISTILAIACIGWFGIQAEVCGSSFSSMIASMTGLEIPVVVSSVIWGVIMVLTACFGFGGLKWLNRIAVPLLLFVCVIALVFALKDGGAAAIASYTPAAPITFVTGLSYTVATFAVAGAISADYCRFAKSRKDVVKSSIIGVIPAGFAMLLLGAVLAIATGTYDMSVVLTASGIPLVGLIALILGTWTTNVTNCYSGGLSLSILLGLDEKKSRLCTFIAGIIGTILAAFGILGNIQTFLSLLTALVPAVVGAVIAEYWILNKGDRTKFKMREGFYAPGVIAFVIGAFISCLTGGTFVGFGLNLSVDFFVGPINGLVVSLAIYLILAKLMGKKKE